MAAVAGDYFGMPDDPFHRCPQNISSVIDLLEDAGVSWGEYQEVCCPTRISFFVSCVPRLTKRKGYAILRLRRI